MKLTLQTSTFKQWAKPLNYKSFVQAWTHILQSNVIIWRPYKVKANGHKQLSEWIWTWQLFIMKVTPFIKHICLRQKQALTWSTPHWGWRRSCCCPRSYSAASSGFPQRSPTDRKWSSWWKCCFCPARCTSLFQSETNTCELG